MKFQVILVLLASLLLGSYSKKPPVPLLTDLDNKYEGWTFSKDGTALTPTTCQTLQYLPINNDTIIKEFHLEEKYIRLYFLIDVWVLGLCTNPLCGSSLKITINGVESRVSSLIGGKFAGDCPSNNPEYPDIYKTVRIEWVGEVCAQDLKVEIDPSINYPKPGGSATMLVRNLRIYDKKPKSSTILTFSFIGTIFIFCLFLVF